jgi:curved DNA-binding protein CbpA
MTSSREYAAGANDDFHDYYATLGVAWDADLADLERAYRKLVMRSHPDRFPPESRARCIAETKLRNLNAAMHVLRDAVQRSHYDERFRREKPLTVRLVRGSSRDM